jgi:hypothetical protein
MYTFSIYDAKQREKMEWGQCKGIGTVLYRCCLNLINSAIVPIIEIIKKERKKLGHH